MNNDVWPDIVALDSDRIVFMPGDGAGALKEARLVSQVFANNSKLIAARLDGDNVIDFAYRHSEGLYTYRANTLLTGCSAGLTISGRVAGNNGIDANAGISGATVKLSGAQNATAQTDSDGRYVITGLSRSYTGSYLLTVERAGFEFDPPAYSFNDLITSRALDFVQIRRATTVSAASYSPRAVAPDSIASIFGQEMVVGSAAATTSVLPTHLNLTSVNARDASGIRQDAAPLFFVSPSQINFVVPSFLTPGPATFSVNTDTFISGRVTVIFR